MATLLCLGCIGTDFSSKITLDARRAVDGRALASMCEAQGLIPSSTGISSTYIFVAVSWYKFFSLK